MESSLHSSTSIVYVRLSSITFPFPYWKRLPQHWCRSDTYGAFVEPWKEFCRSYRSILGRICRTSARSLVGLCSISGYISPEAMVTCISALTSIETLHVEFRSPQFSPWLGKPTSDTLCPPVITRSPCNSLQWVQWTRRGIRGSDRCPSIWQLAYNPPRYHRIWHITVCPIYLSQTNLENTRWSSVQLHDSTAIFKFSSQTRGSGMSSVKTACRRPDFSNMVRFSTSFSRPLSSVESLYIHNHRVYPQYPDLLDDIDDT